jgi:hypothetical protein
VAVGAVARKILWSRAHDQCSFPGCTQALTHDAINAASGQIQPSVVGEEAHIRSRQPGGPRHDPDFPKTKLDDYENLLLLCPTHHELVDAHNGDDYTTDDLLAMRQQHEKQQETNKRIDTAVRAYIGDQYAQDDQVLFEQIDLLGPSVDSMFVDVPATCRSTSAPAELLAKIAAESPGDLEAVQEAAGQAVTGAAQALLHPEWVGGALIVGGPGQGKSTLLQYLCQFHRSRMLGKTSYSGQRQQLRPLTDVTRVPFRLELRSYAQWARRQTPTPGSKGSPGAPPTEKRWPSIEEYIVEEVKRRSGGHDFLIEDLATLVAGRPVLLALDGLDEVANLVDRERVSEEIVSTHARLDAGATNLVTLVATRPGATTSRLWSSQSFPALYLQRLSHGLRLQYLQQWAAVAQLSHAKTEKLQRTFMENEHIAHIRELASYPMQLAILLHLLHRRQLLPQQRTELFRDYLKTFLDREQTTNKEPLLAGQRRVIEDVHAFLGWYIQTKAEQGTSSGSVSRGELQRLIRDHLRDRADGLRMAEQLFSAVTSRVLCLVEREQDAFQFDVQSLREYFAAKYIFENAPPRGNGNSRDDCLNELLRRPYWSNVCRFFVGMLSTGEIRGIRHNLEQQTSHRELAVHPHLRSMAAIFLNDRAYEGQRDGPIAEVVEFIFGEHGVLFAEDGLLDVSGPLVLSDGAGREQVIQHIKSRLPIEGSRWRRWALARSMRRHAAPSDDLNQWWWSQQQLDEKWLETAGHLGVLHQTDPEQTAKLAALALSLHSSDTWLTALLVGGGFDGRSEDLVALCIDEINDGAAECVPMPRVDTPLCRLVNAARLAGRWAVAPDHDEHQVKGRRRSRDRGRLGELVAASAEIQRYAGEPDTHDQRKYLRSVSENWQKGWVLRQAIAALPLGADLATIANSFETTDELLAYMISVEATKRQNKANAEWWHSAAVPCDGSLDRRDWVFSLLTVTRPKVIADVAEQLNAFVDGLEPKHYQSLWAALFRVGASPAASRQVLVEPIRLRQVEFSPRVLWLLRTIASDATKEFIDKRLTDSLAALLEPGLGDMRPLLRSVGTAKTVKVDTLRNTRAALPAGGWASDIKLGSISAQRAREVLQSPDNWPSDIVQRATETLAERIVNGNGPLAKVAADNNWFPDTG